MIDIEPVSIDIFVEILALSSAEMQDLAQDESQPYVKRKIVQMLSSDNEILSLNTIKWITEQIEIQKSALPKSITEQIRTYGELSYSVDEIIALHQDSAAEIKADWKAKKGLYLSYTQGLAIGKYKIDAQLQERAYKGDLRAIEMINVRKMLK